MILLRSILLIFTTASIALGSSDAFYAKDIRSILNFWEKDQHLYIKGDVGVKKEDLQNLEQWLDSKAPNWTVILMQNAKGEVWQDTRKIDYYGMNAVENAVGRDLSNKIDFLNLSNAATNQKNGAILILFLEEKKFSYFASDAYDSRNLGERSWVGNLDSSAIKAMRNGGGIVGAVTSTLTSIDLKLSLQINKEIEREQSKLSRLASAKAWVERESIAQLNSIQDLQEKLGFLLSQDHLKHNDLANPPINDWKEVISNANKNPDSLVAKKAITEIKNEIATHRNHLSLWNSDQAVIDELNTTIRNFQPHKKQNQQSLSNTQTLLAKATELHSQGKQAYRQPLLDTQQLYVSLEADKLELTRIAGIAARDQAIKDQQRRTTVTTATGASGIGLIGLGIYSNRRRRNQKTHAEELYQQWQDAMKSRVDNLFSTMDRASIIVGSERDLPQRGYAGQTLEESINAIRNVDKAFILSASVDSALQSAKKLIYPSNSLAQASNLLRRHHYDEAIKLLERSSLKADPIRQEMKVAERGEDSMLGDKSKADKVEMKFIDLIREFDNTLKSANTSLDLVEYSWETISSRSESLCLELEKIELQETQLENAAKQDGLYQLETLYDHWLPKTQLLYENGISTGKNDPVLALKTEIKQADSMVAQMNSLISLAKKFRKTELTKIYENAELLKQLNRDNEWIHDSLKDSNSAIEGISHKALTSSIIDDLKSFSKDLYSLTPKTQLATQLTHYTDTDLPISITEAHDEILDAKTKIATKLKLPTNEIFEEHQQWNPNIILTDAELYRIRSQDLIDQGRISEAQEQADMANAKTKEARKVVLDTIQAQQEYISKLKNIEDSAIKADELAEKGTQVMAKLVLNYHSDALLIDPTDAGYGDLSEIEEAMLSTKRKLAFDIATAKEKYHSGYILTASHNLRNALSTYTHLAGLQKLITNRWSELHGIEQRNKLSLKNIHLEQQSLNKVMEDHRTSSNTQLFYKQLSKQLEHLTLAVKAPHGKANPFKVEALFIESEDRIKALESQIESDREAYAASELHLSLLYDTQAQGELLIKNAQQDGAEDSRETTRAIYMIKELTKDISKHDAELKTPHKIWQDLHSAIQQTNHKISQVNATLRNELELAQQALASIEAASRNVSQAMQWSGSYGVRISGSYGKRSLHGANDALNSGDYHQASSLASRAMNIARSAISAAESEVASIRRARAAEQRHQRMNRRSYSNHASSIGNSASSVRSVISPPRSSSIGSSSSSTSTAASGSGFSRSGW